MSTAEENLKIKLVDNPCRGVATGNSTKNSKIQLSWIMGRSPNSQNRVYTIDGTRMFTEAADSSQVEDPSLIIYNAMDSNRIHLSTYSEGKFVVSNGAQTDTIINKFNEPVPFYNGFKAGVYEHFCEPDEPIFTPRISAIQDAYQPLAHVMAIQKANPDAKNFWISIKKMYCLSPEYYIERVEGDKKLAKELYLNEMKRLTGLNPFAFPTVTEFYDCAPRDGIGLCVTTYDPNDSKHLPSFSGSPFEIPMEGELEDIMQNVWNHLEPQWRVALGGREIFPDGNYRFAEPINIHKK